jgi:hypothetical protein
VALHSVPSEIELYDVPSEATGDDPDEGIAWKDGLSSDLSPYEHYLATGRTNAANQKDND